jgi:ZIP family zinc transporter
VNDTASTSRLGWIDDFLSHLKQRRVLAVLFALVLLTLIIAVLPVPFVLPSGAALRYAVLGGMAGFLATTLGALPAILLRGIPQKLEDGMLGFAAGMMLAASAFSLLLPGIEAGTALLGSRFGGATLVVGGMLAGVVLMLGLDAFTPHQHAGAGPFGPGHVRCSRLWLFVFAIALHNLPEGMAIGVSFAQADLHVGVPLTSAIALQDIPEGLAVALAARAAGLSVSRSVLLSAASGLLEPLGAWLGVMISSGFAWAYPAGLGLAAGAMIFVVSHEVIPETHRNGHQTLATLGLMIGFAVMLILDTTLG